LAVVDYWIAEYFRRSEYFTIDGKPVVIIFSPDLLRRDLGSAAVGAALRLMRARMAAAGLAGLFLIAVGQGDGADLRLLRAEGYDATTGYNSPEYELDATLERVIRYYRGGT
jgi:hypothetical protein